MLGRLGCWLALVALLCAVVFSAACSGSSAGTTVPPVPIDKADAGQQPTQGTVRVVAPTALTTTERGGRATFTVALGLRPISDVVLPIASSDEKEIVAEPTSLRFGTDDWDKPKSVTLIGQDDAVADGDKAVTIAIGPAQSGDTAYSELRVAPVSATNEDDDTAGLAVSVPSPSNASTENGGQTTFTVRLKSQPSVDVTLGVVSTVPTEGKPDKAKLVFTAKNWETPQTITVTGQDDSVADGDRAYDVKLTPQTKDPAYAAIGPTAIGLVNLDDDIPGFFVFPPAVGDRKTTEAGGKALIGVRLRSRPTGTVTIPVSSSLPAEGLPDVSQLVYGPDDYDTVKTVTVTGQDDPVDDGDVAYAIVLGKSSSADASYDALDPPDVDLTNVDDDTAAVMVSLPSPSSQTTEGSGAVTFTVKLATKPTASVTIGVSSSKESEGKADVTSLAFDDTDWNIAKTVTVTGQDDLVDDGNQSYTIVLAKAVSGDPKYAVIDPADVSLTNVDDDTAGVSVGAPSPTATTSESGGKVTVSVVLQTKPTGDVKIPVSVSDTKEATVDTSELTFTTTTWDQAQTITVTGKDDSVDDGDVDYKLVLGAAAGGGYTGIDPDDVSLTNIDDDTAGIRVSTLSGSQTTELGGSVSFTVRLDSRPSGTNTVTIPVSTSNGAIATANKASLSFDTTNWDQTQTVTVTGKDDGVIDGDKTFDIILGEASSGDAKYDKQDPADFIGIVNASACGIGGVNASAGEQGDDANATKCDGCERCESRQVLTLPAGASATFAGIAAALPRGDMCVEAWARVATAGDAILASSYGAVDAGAFMLRCQSGTLSLTSQIDAVNVISASAAATSCDDGSWHHVAGCRSVAAGTVTHTVFLDGTLAASASGPDTSLGANAALVLGGTSVSSAGIPGSIDEVRISNVVRYTTTFTPARRLAPDASTVGLWHFDEVSGTSLSDASGHGYTGTLGAGGGWEADTGYTTAMCL